MTKFLSLIAVFACFYAINASSVANFSTCSTHGLTHFRGFSTADYVEACYQSGTKVLFQNQWVKVSMHTYLNETTMDYDWKSSKIFVEIFGDLPDVPIALFSSDMILYNCSSNCFTDFGKVKMGVDGAVDITMKKDDDSNVLYIYYKRAQITMYIRKGLKTLNFGIHAPSYMLQTSSGMCVSSCPRFSEHETYGCLKGSSLVKVVDVCKLLFIDIKPATFVDIALVACSHDMVLWRDINAGIDSRFTYIDELMIEDFETIEDRYVFGKIKKSSLTQYQSLVDEIKCGMPFKA